LIEKVFTTSSGYNPPLQKKEVNIKDCSSKFEEGSAYARIADRLPSENLILLEALQQYGETITF